MVARTRKHRRLKTYRTGSYTSLKSSRTYMYRSSYELRLMRCLDVDDEVSDWTYEQTVIYHKQNRVLTEDQVALSDRTHRSYTPDFVITLKSGDILMIEAKSASNVYTKATQRKKHLGEQFCAMYNMRYMIWTLDDIIPYERRMGIRMRDHSAWEAAQKD